MLVELTRKGVMQGLRGWCSPLCGVEFISPWSTFIGGKGVRSEGQNGDSHHLLSLRDALEVSAATIALAVYPGFL